MVSSRTLRRVGDALGWDEFVEMTEDLYGTFTDRDYWYGDYDDRKLKKFQALYSIPGFRQIMDYNLDLIKDEQYLERYGMTYADVKDPRKLASTASAGQVYGIAWSMISRNVSRLYR